MPLTIEQDRPMKIVMVHNTYQQPGGEDVVFQQECANLARAGHEVVRYERSNFEIDQLSAVGRLALPKNTIWSAATRRDFGSLLDREHPDVVHVHNTFVMVSPSIYAACRATACAVVQTLHNFRLLCPGATLFRDGKSAKTAWKAACGARFATIAIATRNQPAPPWR